MHQNCTDFYRNRLCRYLQGPFSFFSVIILTNVIPLFSSLTAFALGAFLLYLTIALGTPVYSLVGGLFFATTVLTVRTIFLCVDKGWKCPYTKLAIPCETLFVIALWVCFILSKTLY